MGYVWDSDSDDPPSDSNSSLSSTTRTFKRARKLPDYKEFEGTGRTYEEDDWIDECPGPRFVELLLDLPLSILFEVRVCLDFAEGLN